MRDVRLVEPNDARRNRKSGTSGDGFSVQDLVRSGTEPHRGCGKRGRTPGGIARGRRLADQI